MVVIKKVEVEKKGRVFLLTMSWSHSQNRVQTLKSKVEGRTWFCWRLRARDNKGSWLAAGAVTALKEGRSCWRVRSGGWESNAGDPSCKGREKRKGGTKAKGKIPKQRWDSRTGRPTQESRSNLGQPKTGGWFWNLTFEVSPLQLSLLRHQIGNEFRDLNKSSDSGERRDEEKSTRIKLMRWEKRSEWH